MRSRALSLIYPATRIFLAVRVMLLLIAPAATAHAAGGEWQQFPNSPVARQPITAILADRSDGIWAGTDERGVARWNGASWSSFTTSAGLPDNRIVALYEDTRGRVWVATGTGLGYFPADGGAFRRVGGEGIPAYPVTTFAEDETGALWLGTPLGLVSWHEDGAFENAGELQGKRVLALLTAGDGTMWAGTDDGLWRRGAAGWEQQEGPSPGPVTSLALDGSGALHALAGGKVWRLDGDGWAPVPVAFRPHVTTFAFEGDQLWLGSSGGIDTFKDGLSQRYDASLLPGGNLTRIAVERDGRIWFGTTTGLVAHRPDEIAPVIESVTVNGETAGAEAGDPVTLERNQVRQIAVTARDGAENSGGQVLILAQLDDLDRTPRVSAGGILSAYKDVSLSPGRHTLRLWAVDEAFNRSEPRQITIDVPDLAYLPLGIAIPAAVIAPVLTALILVLLAAVAAVAVVGLRRRAKRRAAANEEARVRAILDRAGNPYEGELAYEPALRSEQAEQIVGALTGPSGRSVLVLGSRGIGKTALLRQLAAGPSPLAAAYVDLASCAEDALFAEAISGLYAALTPQMIGDRPLLDTQARGAAPYGEREFAADLGRLLAFVGPSASAPLNAALLLDNANRLDGFAGAQRDAVRRLVLASGGSDAPLRLVLAAETPPASLDGLTDLLATVQLPPLAAQAMERLLLRPAEGSYEWDADATRGAVALSQGRPGRLREIAERAVTSARRDGRVRILRTDVAPVRSAP